MRAILVLTDFSTASDRALRQAEILGRVFGSQLHLFHKVVYPPPIPPTGLLDRLDDAARFDYVLTDVIERPEREAREELDERAEALRARGLSVTTHLERSGDLYGLVEGAISAIQPDLVVMGTHGRAGVQKWLMGSLAEKVLRHAAVDVLTLHEDSPVAGDEGGLGEVLVPTDFSECSRRALEAAFRLTKEAGGRICLLHVIEPQPLLPWAEGQETLLVEVDDALRARFEAALRDELRGRKGDVVLAEGAAAREIERVARERGASLIVLGTHGRGRLAHALIGSVAERVTRFSRLPVLTVR
jgi:nucleotide-binding universal stress UspA family protein